MKQTQVIHRFYCGKSGVDICVHGCPVALGEFAVGFKEYSDPVLLAVRRSAEIISSSQSVAFSYARIYYSLKKQLLGANDLWIAAYAIDADLPLVTNNVKEFRRVPGLMVVTY